MGRLDISKRKPTETELLVLELKELAMVAQSFAGRCHKAVKLLEGVHPPAPSGDGVLSAEQINRLKSKVRKTVLRKVS